MKAGGDDPRSALPCRKCNKVGQSYRATGRVCRECLAQQSRAWYEANKERAKASRADYAKRRPEVGQAAKRRYVERDPDKVAQAKAEWARFNPDKVRASRAARSDKAKSYKSQWYERNKEAVNLKSRAWALAHPERRQEIKAVRLGPALSSVQLLLRVLRRK